MNLDKSEALMIYTVLFHYLNTSNLDHVDVESIEDVVDRLHNFLVGSSHDADDDDVEEDEDEDDSYDEEEDDSEDEDEEDETVELYVTPAQASSLPPITVISPDGSKVSFEFEDIDEKEVIDALFDNGSVIIEGVKRFLVLDGSIRLDDGEEWHAFKTTKYPKTWKKVFPVGVVTGFCAEEENE